MKVQGFRFGKQVPIDRFVVDVACLSCTLVVEVDGEQHGWKTHVARDTARDRRLAGPGGYRVLRFWNHEVDRQMPMVLETVYEHAGRRAVSRGPEPCPSFPPSPIRSPGCR